MRLSFSQTQKIGMITIILLLFFLSTVILFHEGASISSLKNIKDIHLEKQLIISKINQKFLLVGLHFFRYSNDLQKQKVETKKDLDSIKGLLLSYQQLIKKEVQFHQQPLLKPMLFFKAIRKNYRQLLTAYYAYYSNIYPTDISFEYSRVSKQLLEKIISQSSKNASNVLLQLNKTQTKQLANEINKIITFYLFIFLIILVIIVTIILILFLLSTLLNRSIKEIQESAKKISDGNFDEPIKAVSRDDLGILASTIDKMRINLKSYVKSLKSEIDKRKKSEEKVSYLAYHDELTGLPNRSYFNRILEREIEKAKRNNYLIAILFIDVDNFKSVNDTYGHNFGDLLICETAKRIKNNIRAIDIVTRISGDEFIVLLSSLKAPNESLFIGEKLLHMISKPFKLKLIEVSVTASIGISIFPLSSKNSDELLKHADIAMYRAKQSGRNNCKSYAKKLDAAYKKQMLLANKLPFALENNEFYLVYQPIIDSRTEKTIGMEVLLRWLLPSHGLIPPNIFIPIAEKSGIFNELGFWVIENTFVQLKQWQTTFDLSENYISINLSTLQLDSEKIYRKIFKLANQLEINTKNVGFEVTESSIMLNLGKSKQILRNLHRDGFKLLIDDFGTGFSSFARLKELKITTLKIDKTFIDDIGVNEMGERITKSIILLAETLGLSTIAEGVETKKQMEFLKENKAYFVQGFYYSKPLKAEDMTKYLKTH